ncbi:MAG: M17 family peptidase N-terminal domain-containing protein, partial [Noviherbaspirillum sp.]
MDFSIKTYDTKNPLAQLKTGCIVVGVFEDKKMSAAATALDGTGAISAAQKSGDISGKPGSTLLVRGCDGVTAERILLVGLGKEEPIGAKDFSGAAQAAARVLATLGGTDAVLALPYGSVKERDPAWAMQAAVLAARENGYRFDQMKSKQEPAAGGVKKVALAVEGGGAAAKTALTQAVALANGMDLT